MMFVKLIIKIVVFYLSTTQPSFHVPCVMKPNRTCQVFKTLCFPPKIFQLSYQTLPLLLLLPPSSIFHAIHTYIIYICKSNLYLPSIFIKKN